MLTVTRISLNKLLKGPMKPRVLESADLFSLMLKFKPDMAITTYYRNLNTMLACGDLRKVNRNLYLNMQAVPKVDLNEVAEYLEKGAVISLHSALAHAGILNNPSVIVTSLVPVHKFGWRGGRRNEIKTQVGTFWMYQMPEEAVSCPEIPSSDLFVQTLSYRMATPEKALIDWIYVASSPRMRMPGGMVSFPPLDIEMDRLDKRLLVRISRAMGVEESYREWLSVKQDHDASSNVRQNMSLEMGF